MNRNLKKIGRGRQMPKVQAFRELSRRGPMNMTVETIIDAFVKVYLNGHNETLTHSLAPGQP